jgi:hypothetical protein
VGLATAALTFLVPGPVTGAEPIIGRAIPDEPPIVTLAPAWTAIVLDLDADGVRELVAIGPAPGDPTQVAVNAWWVATDGAVARAESVALPAADGAPLSSLDGTSVWLTSASHGGTQVPLVATSSPAEGGDGCCAVWAVALNRGELTLRRVAELANGPVQMAAVDMDADGTDEVLVTSQVSAATVGLTLLRWRGDVLGNTELTIRNVASASFTILDVGETDRLPGEEALLTGPATLGSDGLFRMSLRRGAAVLERVETAALPAGDSGFASVQVLDTENGPGMVSSDGYGSMGVWAWPPDGQPTPLATREGAPGILRVLGTDATARLTFATTPFLGIPEVDGYQLEGWPGHMLEPADDPVILEMDERAASFVSTVAIHQASHPFVGRIPGGLPGFEDPLVWAGLLVSPRVPSGMPMAILAGLEPIGTVGPADAWMVLGPAVDRRPCCFYGWQPGPDVADRTSPADLPADPDSSLRLAARASVLEPERDGGQLSPTWHGAVVDPDRPGELRVGSDPVQAEISGPEGTTVWWSADVGPGAGPDATPEPSHTRIGPSGSGRLTVLEPARIDSERGSAVTVRMWAVSPSGHGYAGSWPITIDRAPPLLALAEPPLVDFEPSIDGIGVGIERLTVDGDPVPVADDGTFTTAVDVGLVPTDFRVVAHDDLGNLAEEVVTLVWGVDYRRLPFVPFAVVATIAAGILLYLRGPGAGARRPPDGVGTFEEIGR